METKRLDFSRQHLLINDEIIKEPIIHIFGIGSVGSILTYTMSKVGFKKFVVYDYDKVEQANIPTQIYGISDEGKLKTEALKEFILKQTGIIIETRNKRIINGNNLFIQPQDVIISCFDNMGGRRLLFNKAKENGNLFIDTRIGKFFIEYFFIDTTDKVEREKYKKLLFNENEVVDLKCGEKACFLSNAELSSRVTMNLIKYLEHKPYNKQYYGNIENHTTDIVC